ncbi:tetratricopeptide repeat protein [Thalassotalea nanhaiensis]|uniref:Tetratricopeptide repeat protein n=1 Tax=Thalassotalea nanhaiensis TaxID=3065648 RepID=A0ABY9TLG7_9GAMM|nr:tetratricopeptide repeat protein [Colwelliaceae bacterium SQ345]
MSEFHFIRPLWLLAVIVLVWVIWQLRKIRISSSAWHHVIPKHLANMLLSSNENKKPVSLIPASVIGLLFIFALAGPTWQKLPQPVFDVERGSVVIMDMSFSMMATDIKPNRLTMARFKAMDLVEKIDEGEIGLVAYAGDAFIISPLTADIENIKLLLPSLSPSIMPELGSNPYPALILANEMLQNAGHLEGDIYWVTDGISSDELSDITDFANEHPHRINILGVGSEQGAPITLANGELMKDRGGNIVIPKMNAPRLARISKNSGGVFSQITADDSDLENLSELKALDAKKEMQNEQDNLGDQWQEMGPYLLLIALPLMLGYFRRGVLFTPVLLSLVIASSLHTPKAEASLWDDLWQTKNQQAQSNFEKQQYAEAAKQFSKPLWQGSSYYKAGDFEKALEAFKQVESTESRYNQGNALAKLQQYDDAINAYDEVLTQNPDHQDAAINKALVEQLKQQEQQQDQSNQEQNSDDSNQEQNQEQSEQQQSGENGDNDNNQDQNQQDGENQDQQQQDQNQQDGENQDQQSQDSQSQESPNGDQNPNEQESEQQSKDNEQQSAEQDESEQEQNAAAQADNAEQDEQQSAQDEQSAGVVDSASNEDAELNQKHEQMLRKVTDDPQLLLRNKMKLEYQKRRQNRSSIGVKEKW